MTQYQHLGAVPRITHHYLIPLLEALLTGFPFRIRGLHADNGSEYVNHRVAEMLSRLHIDDFTRSRPRHSNDNALVETKNGAVVRRWLGHFHIPKRMARPVDAFLRDQLSPFLNHHRPCLFAVETIDRNGRVRRRYPQDRVATRTIG